MFALRHKGDGWYWTGTGWTDKPYDVKRLTRQEAEDQEKAFALQAADYRAEKVRPVVDVVPIADMLQELRWLADEFRSADSHAVACSLGGNPDRQAGPCFAEAQG